MSVSDTHTLSQGKAFLQDLINGKKLRLRKKSVCFDGTVLVQAFQGNLNVGEEVLKMQFARFSVPAGQESPRSAPPPPPSLLQAQISAASLAPLLQNPPQPLLSQPPPKGTARHIYGCPELLQAKSQCFNSRTEEDYNFSRAEIFRLKFSRVIV